MANVDNPHGLALVRVRNGGAVEIEEFAKVVGYNKALFPGDIVNRVADGSIESSVTPNTTLISGVNLSYAPTLTASTHLVITDPTAIFEAQGDNGTALAAEDMGLNCDLVSNAGDATTKKSGHEIDASEKAVTADLDVKLHKLLNVEGNAYGEFARIEISINAHRMQLLAAGV